MQTYTPEQAAQLTGVPYRTLHRWITDGLIRPKYRRANIRKRDIELTTKDVREISILCALRRGGLSMQTLRDVLDYLRSIGHNPMSTGQFIAIMGKSGKPADLVKICTTGEALELIGQCRGQLVLPIWTPPAGDVEVCA